MIFAQSGVQCMHWIIHHSAVCNNGGLVCYGLLLTSKSWNNQKILHYQKK